MPPLPTGGLGSAGHGGGGNQPNQFYQRPSAAGAGAARQAPTDTIRSWRDVRHLDVFLTRIYQYYTGKGFLCIILNSVVTIATAAFVIFLSTFLFACINYDLIHEKKRLSDIIEPNCIAGMSFGSLFVVAMFGVWWILQVIRLLFDIPRHREMQYFFTNVLGITDDELQNTLWRDVVAKIVQTRAQQSQANPTAALRRLDAHAIANRILRKDNYLIALFNKDILNLSVPLFGSRQIMSKLMEWNLSYCIFSYVFDDKGVFRKRFLKENNRARLVDGLQKRFRNMAYMNLLLSPFLLIFLVLYSFFKYAEEYQRNPSGLGARQYSPFAWWKFREFNELPHLLQMRLNRSTDNANTYIRQFPKEYLIILAKFVSFVSGSLAAILLAITLFEEELQQGFEITPGRSAFFYIGIFGAILALSRGLIPPDTEVFEPERWMREVALDTHYMPDEWRSRAHTDEVKQQFEALYDFKLALWAWELLSVVLAPAVLYYSLPPCAEEIVDFFREFTVHVEAYGYVCSFAVFDFKRHGNVKFGVQPDGQGQVAQQQQQQQQQQQAQTPHFVSKEGKMEHSFVNFKANYPNWDPGLEGSEYISRLLARRRAMRPSHLGQTAHSFHGATPSSSHGDGLGQSRHDFMPSASMEATAPHMQYDGGLNGYGAGHGAGQDMMMESYLRGEQSVMQASHIEQRIGRELFGLLDAVYETNRRLL
ncbi:autophagy protein Apg9-domain-containing protein [Entophlyctis helioformis]|nr:autophagy protein Apg9-domain-containing protein [Entophlyctis helioformis]